MNNDGQDIFIGGIYRPGLPRRSGVKAGAWPANGMPATKMPLLTELVGGINDIRLFYENDVRFLKQF
jgi:phenylalanyl-tRNA synthetase alpha subunit